jgi:hypothetical protein
MKWSKEVPKESGYYWWKSSIKENPKIINFFSIKRKCFFEVHGLTATITPYGFFGDKIEAPGEDKGNCDHFFVCSKCGTEK